MKIAQQLSLLVVNILVLTQVIYAQSTDTLPQTPDNTWIEKMTDKMAIDLSLNNSFETFEVKTPTNRYAIAPNKETNLRLKLSYKFLSISAQVSPGFIPGNGDQAAKGKTKSFQLGTALIFNHWFTDLSYEKVKGYYLENTKAYIPWVEGDPYIQFPDLHYNGISISGGYSSNTNFSFRSLTSQTERQLKSAGSIIPVAHLRFYKLDDKSSGASTQKSNNFEFGAGPGYVYTFVVKQKLYLSLGLLSSLGYLNTTLTTRLPAGDITTKQNNFVFQWDAKVGIGYNDKSFYTGLYGTLSETEYGQENTAVRNFEKRIYYHVFVGFRLQAPEFLRQDVAKIESKIHSHS